MTAMADVKPQDFLLEAWTSKKESDLDDAVYTAVRRSPKDVIAIVEFAFTLTGKSMEKLIVDAAIKALREGGTLECDDWSNIKSGGVAKSDEDKEEYMISDLVEYLAPTNCRASMGGGALPGDPANAAPPGGVGSPATTSRVIEVEGGNPSNPPTGGGGSPEGPPFEEPGEETPPGSIPS
jgi:hypothetical protein